ncbi:DUF2157 domain-containing protein [Undibacterium sp. Jales W-56]|uniref:DUF2157 domain-containing protein n=1 Tax=Undibacterium sp. Jales W-56 TaxID=2897325 RepID=UPI0021D2DBC3|nr:DUF2157 domain-containing protein [Undibacterium sp. Jales W-56]MCU6435608.1 DUF2157 domain-containing protein [Undibacterium sp. Jales W-56]
MGKLCKREALMEAADLGLLHYGQVDPLLQFLEARARKAGYRSGHGGMTGRNAPTRFSGTTVLYYLGGMLAIAACSLFSTLAVEKWGMPVLLDLSLVYLLFAVALASWLDKRGLGAPAGIFATLAIALVPLAIFALQHVLGWWADSATTGHYRDFHRWIDWHWLTMELATLLAGALMLWRFQYSFLVMPISVTLFYMGMDVVPAILMQGDAGLISGNWHLRQQISLVFGLGMLVLALIVDLRSRRGIDYAFWLYLFGLLTFWGALSSMGDGALSGKLMYLAINTGLIFIGAILARRVFAVFGGIGLAMVLGDLSWHLFKDSFVFVALLTVLGFALIAAGLWWSKHEAHITAKLSAILPESLQSRLMLRGIA